jgi:hypothetical protein
MTLRNLNNKKMLLAYASDFNQCKENFAKFKKTAKFSGDPFENSLNNDDLVNYSKFSKAKAFLGSEKSKHPEFQPKFFQKLTLFLYLNEVINC